ncbi:MAG: hypothetical protein M3O80_06435 [Chloroflexota bacterium]|nr:hypothetical protein [Chloroflexota bacterium]
MIALFVLGLLGVVLVPLWFVGRLVQLARAKRGVAPLGGVIDIRYARARRRRA